MRAEATGRNETVDALRVVAAFLVCLFHFTSTAHMQESNFLRPLAQYGVRGIDVFFVISGFIVPFAMTRAGYTLASWPRFIARRLVRLEPPYLVSIAIMMGVQFLFANVGETRVLPSWSVMQVASHVGYWTAFAGYEWLSPVYWSLAIEFQFYLIIGLTLPLLLARTATFRIVALLSIALLSIPLREYSAGTIVPFLPTFSVGLATFFMSQGLVRSRPYWAALVVLGSLILVLDGAAIAIAAIGTAVVIATVRIPRIPLLAWLGSISYSLYLLHVPIGMPFVALAARFGSGPLIELLAVTLGTVASVAGAALLFWLVESPALKLAARIRYRTITRGPPSHPNPAIASR